MAFHTTTDANGYLRYSKGFALGKGGKRVQKFFSLGTERERAERIARALEMAWENEASTDAQGKKVWSQESIDRAYAFAEPKATANPVPSPVPAPQKQAFVDKSIQLSYTLGESLDDFVEWFGKRDDISATHLDKFPRHVKSIQHHLKLAGLDKVPMTEVDQEKLEEIRRICTSRPLSRMTVKEGEQPCPISPQTVSNWLMVLGMAFDHFKRSPKYGWKPIDDEWRKNFCITHKAMRNLLTPAERDDAGKAHETFTIEELSVLYSKATPWQRTLMLTGLMLGWTQTEVSSFRKPHYVKIGDEYFVDRRREKTGVPALWWVCPELAERLNREISTTPSNQGDLALLTENGKSLVHGKTDTIKLAWGLVLKKATKQTDVTVRPLSFKYLRKTGSQMIRNLGGEFMAQLFLAHKPQTVSSIHYNSAEAKVGYAGEQNDFDRLHELQKKMHQMLKPMFDAAVNAQLATQEKLAKRMDKTSKEAA